MSTNEMMTSSDHEVIFWESTTHQPKAWWGTATH
jgi:hypothetical protein